MASSEVSISQLPVVNSVNKGDFLIIQTPNATNRLDFENFVVGLDNTSFSSTIEQHTTDILALSARVPSTNPSISQVILTEREDITGSGNTAVDLTDGTNKLETYITVKDTNSLVRITAQVTGETENQKNAVFTVLSSDNGSSFHEMVQYLSAFDSGASADGVVGMGGFESGDGGAGELSNATIHIIHKPTSLDSNNRIYYKVAVRVEAASTFHFNGPTAMDSTGKGAGTSSLLLEEVRNNARLVVNGSTIYNDMS